MSETRKARQKIIDDESIAMKIREHLSADNLTNEEAFAFLEWLADELDAYADMLVAGRRPDRQMVSR